MNLSEPAVDGLARTWIWLHGRAAEPHLSHLIDWMRQSGDFAGAATYGHILNRVCAARGTEKTPEPAAV